MTRAIAAAIMGPYALDTPNAIATPAKSNPAPSAGAIHGRSGALAKFFDSMPPSYRAPFSWVATLSASALTPPKRWTASSPVLIPAR